MAACGALQVDLLTWSFAVCVCVEGSGGALGSLLGKAACGHGSGRVRGCTPTPLGSTSLDGELPRAGGGGARHADLTWPSRGAGPRGRHQQAEVRAIWLSAGGGPGGGQQGLWFVEWGLRKKGTEKDGHQRQKARKSPPGASGPGEGKEGPLPKGPGKLISSGVAGRWRGTERPGGAGGSRACAQLPGTLRMKPERCLVKSGSGWLSRVSTDTVHFFPWRLHCTGLVTLT